VALALALFLFDESPLHALLAAAEGAALALWPIMIVIVAAIFTYNLAVRTGSLDVIKRMLVSISPDKRIQVLILTWGFGGFLEAVAGYGTAVAIPASILTVLGFNPLFAAVLSLIANTVPTAFGAVGIPVSTLATITGLDVMPLSLAVALQLSPFIILIPFVLVILTGRSLRAISGVFWITLASGLSFALFQFLAAAFLGAELPALLGSLAAMVTVISLARILPHPAPLGLDLLIAQDPEKPNQAPGFREALLAWLPYILIFVFIIVTSPLFPPLNQVAKTLRTHVPFHPEGSGLTFYWLTPGMLIILASFLGGRIQKATWKTMFQVLGKTLVQMGPSTLTVVSILAMAKIMGYSGMIQVLAGALVQATGSFFPLISPLIGALGTFVTGSDTSSNILFGNLQTQVGRGIGVSPYWLAAANTAGATAGKMISPQSIAVATSATGLQGSEGAILSRTLLVCLVYVLVLGTLVFFLGGWAQGFFGG